MSLWGCTGDRSKAKFNYGEKKGFATKGWVREAGSRLSGNGNTSATPEVLGNWWSHS